jgi:hypothetical protein
MTQKQKSLGSVDPVELLRERYESMYIQPGEFTVRQVMERYKLTRQEAYRLIHKEIEAGKIQQRSAIVEHRHCKVYRFVL